MAVPAAHSLSRSATGGREQLFNDVDGESAIVAEIWDMCYKRFPSVGFNHRTKQLGRCGQGGGNALCDMGLKHALETFSMGRLRLSGIFYLNRS